ncbi:hypothetical protein EMIHUDRAFT_235766 [Emiliania huxleyi CCMP1516]|uniref:Secreted protein n=2 Tax=Emiliania huxleyi TaxID=2903 RepID=A0A0D3JV99_EMIH1|nr:hypothetical protein EMIHUDRAFT_235766 [Emiliania huxleyi CCMP1516]EOD27434.1 hypothetical protein EMIHUDRAFT_235766 [Emiliania huxleyi CCMP1516]|eukprot:XP_005779863.1 hypothetical protein EMIHUDRAFT_235766 [Emiliania huxleyi CCMP1516]
MRAVASSLSWIHLCTAPVAASATTCKFLVTPAPRQAPLSECAIVALGGFSSSSVHCCAAFRTIGHSGSRFSAALLAASLAALQTRQPLSSLLVAAPGVLLVESYWF